MDTTIDHDAVTRILTDQCHAKTSWDQPSALAILETDPQGATTIRDLTMINDGMNRLQINNSIKPSQALKITASAMHIAYINTNAPLVRPGHRFTGIAFLAEAWVVEANDDGEPKDQPNYSNNLGDNPNATEMFTATAYTPDNTMHQHMITRNKPDSHKCKQCKLDSYMGDMPPILRQISRTIQWGEMLKTIT